MAKSLETVYREAEAKYPPLTVAAVQLRLGLDGNKPLSITKMVYRLERRQSIYSHRHRYSKQAITQFILPRAFKKLRCYLEIANIDAASWEKLRSLKLVPQATTITPSPSEIILAIQKVCDIEGFRNIARGKNKRLAFEVLQCGVVKIARIFGIAGDPIQDKHVFERIGDFVWTSINKLRKRHAAKKWKHDKHKSSR